MTPYANTCILGYTGQGAVVARIKSRRHRGHSMKLKVTRSSGNVFRDLGFPPEEAEHLRVRADLLIQIQKALEARGLKQAEAAKLLGVTQPRVSDLVRGRLDLFSVDILIAMLARLGVRSSWSSLLPRSNAASPNRASAIPTGRGA